MRKLTILLFSLLTVSAFSANIKLAASGIKGICAANIYSVSGESKAAAGGIITNYIVDGTNYQAHIFLSNGIFDVFGKLNCEILIVAGGGSAGMIRGSGGGAGGLLHILPSLDAGSYSIVVGSGGIAPTEMVPTPGQNGGNSSFGTNVAVGGGGGGAGDHPDGLSGGSGGGGWGDTDAQGGIGGDPILGQGFAGGTGTGYGGAYGAGGGGGAGDVGADGTTEYGGDGGVGLEFPQFASIGGDPAGWFAGGGAGGYDEYSEGGVGGMGGKGGGGDEGESGVQNTGGGGGGNHLISSGGGGSGIVIIKYVQ